jgi:hypothetical protein
MNIRKPDTGNLAHFSAGILSHFQSELTKRNRADQGVYRAAVNEWLAYSKCQVARATPSGPGRAGVAALSTAQRPSRFALDGEKNTRVDAYSVYGQDRSNLLGLPLTPALKAISTRFRSV